MRKRLYISRLKLNTRVSQRNENPECFRDGKLKKKSEYLSLSMEDIMERLQPGKTLEIPDVYIRMYEKLPARLVVYRLTETQIKKETKIRKSERKRKGLRTPNIAKSSVRWTYILKISKYKSTRAQRHVSSSIKFVLLQGDIL